LKTVITYLFILLFAFTFTYKTVKYLIKASGEVAFVSDIDCENEKEDALEKEIIDPFYNNTFFQNDKLILAEEIQPLKELVVNFNSEHHRNPVYSPPELLS
jgi:hypothetical protein